MKPLSIEATTISAAWAQTFLKLMEGRGSQQHPAVIVMSGLKDDSPVEDARIRQRLDGELKRKRKSDCQSVASTIFPNSLWNPALPAHDEVLYGRYEKAWPGIRKCPANRNGVYFRRLTSFHPIGSTDVPINQLKFIAETYRKGNHRKSALQVSVLDPTRDHTHSPRRGFPCLQQVAFTPLDKQSLSVTGFYATQYQFEKAYGNYLGLYWLGRFMAKQFGLKLAQVVCIASMLSLGDPSKSVLQDLAADIRKAIP